VYIISFKKSSLENCAGEYFMICEDDVSFNNTILINKTLKDIILNTPSFDKLILNGMREFMVVYIR
jgi:hypothetical protein